MCCGPCARSKFELAIRRLLHSTQVYAATVGPGDLVWMPSHTLILEMPSVATNVIGVRLGAWCPRETYGMQLFQVSVLFRMNRVRDFQFLY